MKCRATDDAGNSSSASTSYTVIDNRLPTAVNDAYSTDEETLLTSSPGLLANDSDPDDDALTVELVTPPLHGVLTLNPNGIFDYLPNADFIGTDSFRYVVNDGFADSNVATVSITVLPVNVAPVATDDTVTTAEDTPLTFNVASNDSDVDGNLVPDSVTPLRQPANGSISNHGDGSFTYTPTPNVNGTDSFDYRICDSEGLCDDATVTVNITPVNDAPVATDDSVTTAEDTPLTFNVAANDSDIDGNLASASATALTQPSLGTLTNHHDGGFTYTPAPNANGLESFTYQICDSDNLCASALVTITVTAVNDDPVCDAAIPSATSFWPPNHRFEPVTISGISDVEGDAIAITIDTIFQDEPVAGDPDGEGIGADTAQVRVERDGNGNGRYYHIGFTAGDGNGGFCSGTVQVSVPKSQDDMGVAVDDGPRYDSTETVSSAAVSVQQSQLFLPLIVR